MNVLFLTHSYPRDDGDAAGSFILRLARALVAENVSVRVVAPGATGLASHESLGGVPVDRFRYAPRRFETLAYGGNMAAQVRDSWSARFTLVGFLGAEFQAGVRARREFQPDLVHAHWWFPNGLAATWVARMGHIPLVTTMHGTDVRMARNIPVSRPAFRHVMQHSAAVTTVSRWLAEEAQADREHEAADRRADAGGHRAVHRRAARRAAAPPAVRRPSSCRRRESTC